MSTILSMAELEYMSKAGAIIQRYMNAHRTLLIGELPDDLVDQLNGALGVYGYTKEFKLGALLSKPSLIFTVDVVQFPDLTWPKDMQLLLNTEDVGGGVYRYHVSYLVK